MRGGKGKNRFYSYFIYNFLDFNHSRRIVSFSSSYLYLYMLSEFLFCFFICSFDFFFIPVSNNMIKKEKLTERYWYVSTILCIWQGTLNTFKRKLIPFLSQLSLLLFKTVPGNLDLDFPANDYASIKCVIKGYRYAKRKLGVSHRFSMWKGW